MNWRAMWAIVRKDLTVVMQNKGVMIPLLVVPLVFFVLLPGLAGFAPRMAGASGGSMGEITELLDRMPPSLLGELSEYDEVQMVVVLLLKYLFAPMYLIVPLMVASVIAADSFAGEKERKTLEALVYTPTTDQELYLAKLLSAWLPAVAVAAVGFVIYAGAADIAAGPVIGRAIFPNVMWVVLVVWVAPAVAALGLGTMVLVSSRAQGFQDAYQLGAVVVLPVLFLMIGQMMGVMIFSTRLVAALGAVVWLVDLLLIWLGTRMFRRGQIMARM